MTAPDFTPEQLATLERIEAAPAAPESFIGSDGLTNDQRRALSPRIGNGLEAKAKQWLVFDVGCLECGESSSVVGVYPTEAEAQLAVLDRSGDESGYYFVGGQHSVEVFQL